VDFDDLALFADCWHQTNHAQCGTADFNNDGKVDFDDLGRLAESRLLALEEQSQN